MDEQIKCLICDTPVIVMKHGIVNLSPSANDVYVIRCPHCDYNFSYACDKNSSNETRTSEIYILLEKLRKKVEVSGGIALHRARVGTSFENL